MRPQDRILGLRFMVGRGPTLGIKGLETSLTSDIVGVLGQAFPASTL